MTCVYVQAIIVYEYYFQNVYIYFVLPKWRHVSLEGDILDNSKIQCAGSIQLLNQENGNQLITAILCATTLRLSTVLLFVHLFIKRKSICMYVPFPEFPMANSDLHRGINLVVNVKFV